ncbi:MAG: phosphoribosylanthranilate isomerase [Solirubrobacteraceae bacterium]|jgi:phosphoribosylanthranilate isomerase|nr:phosphoribosylanthranilate isomerase [Solirubrobacteraceae bacterium]
MDEVPAPPRVKICGITNLEDAELAAGLGAWALGLIFFEGSPRRCTMTEAQRISSALRRKVDLCGVFVNASLDEVAGRSEQLGLTLLQLHGDEGPAFCAEAARRTGARVIKAVQLRSAGDLQALAPFHTDFHMVDGHARGLYGGTGHPVDWSVVGRRRSDVPLILSGGLTPDNVGEGIEVAKPFAVDTASGTEAEPGRKDPAKLEAFFAAVRATASDKEHAA